MIFIKQEVNYLAENMQEYEYYYEGAKFYCYPDTNVLINKFHIKDDAELDEIERGITYTKTAVYMQNPISGKFDFEHFCAIHRFLFEDIYEWAGKIRTGGFMSKGGTVFAKSDFIEGLFSEYYEKLEKENFLIGLDKERFCERLAYFMAEVNTIHPFREGNGRTTKLYFDQLAQKAGYKIKFSLVDKDELILADVLAYQLKYDLSIEILNKIVMPLES